MSKTFHIGDIISVVHGRLVSPIGVRGLYEILNHLTQDDLYTHQLPRAMRECRPWLIRSMPWLESIDVSGVTAENWREWLEVQVALHGSTFDIEPIPADDHDRIDPIAEAVRMVGPERVFVVRADGDSTEGVPA